MKYFDEKLNERFIKNYCCKYEINYYIYIMKTKL